MTVLHVGMKPADDIATDARKEDEQNGTEWTFAGSAASAATGIIQISYR